MLRRWPALSRMFAVAAGLACGILGAEATFGQLRPGEGQAVLYSIEVRNEAGDLLASPMLVGQEGQPLHLDYVGPRSIAPGSEGRLQVAGLNMSLDLDPKSDGENICLGYKLSLDEGFPHSGRVGVSYGEPRSVRLNGGGENLRLSLVVARAHSPQFERLLHRRRRPSA